MPKHICPKCGSALPDGAETCSVCGADVRPTPAPNPAPGTAEGQGGAPAPGESGEVFPFLSGNPGLSRRTFIAPLVIVLLFAAVLVGLRIFSPGGEEYGDAYLLYLRDRELYYAGASHPGGVRLTDGLFSSDVSDEDLYYLSGSLDKYAAFSEDGGRVFFPKQLGEQFQGDLIYYRDLDPLSDAVLVGEDILEYAVSADGGEVFYRTSGETGASLYYRDLDGGETVKIAEQVAALRVSGDFGTVGYLEVTDSGSSGYDFSLWQPGDADSVTVAEGIYGFEWMEDDLSGFLYRDGHTLYMQPAGGERVTVTENVVEFVQGYDMCRGYYVTLETVTTPLIDFVSGDGRDGLAAELSGETYTLERYSLYYFDGEESTLISDALADAGVIASDARAAAVYTVRADPEPVSVDASEVLNPDQLRSIIDEAYSGRSSVLALGAVSYPLATGNAGGFTFSRSGDALFYVDGMVGGAGELLRMDITGDAPGDPVSLDRGVEADRMSAFGSSSIRYYKDVYYVTFIGDTHNGDLYIDGKKIMSDVTLSAGSTDALCVAVGDGETIAWVTVGEDGTKVTISENRQNMRKVYGGAETYLSDFSDETFTGTLRLEVDGRTIEVADGVSGALYARDSSTHGRQQYLYW